MVLNLLKNNEGLKAYIFYLFTKLVT